MTTIRTLTFATAAALLACGLGACSRSQPDAAAVENQSTDVTEPTMSPDTSLPTPEAPVPATTTATDANATAEISLPPAPAPSPDEQMMDDASATGMTARASRGDDRASDDGSNGAADQPEIK